MTFPRPMGVYLPIEDSRSRRARALAEFARAEFLRRQAQQDVKFWLGVSLIAIAAIVGLAVLS